MTFLSVAFAPPQSLPLSRGAAPLAARATQRRPRVPHATISPPRPKAPTPAPPHAPASAPAQKTRGPRGRVTADGDTLETTPRHVTIVSTHAALAGLLALQAGAAAAVAGDGSAHTLAVVGAYALADLLVGVYHHAVDNYGSGETPVFGYQIAAFQGHHSFPWTIATRSALNNLHRPAAVALPLQVALLLLCAPTPARTLLAGMITFGALSQETHRQAHQARPAAWARALQRLGVIVRPVAHARHHRVPHASNYCILAGWWNPLLDGARVFRAWEAVIFAAVGAQPLGWMMEPALKTQSLRLLPAPLRAAALRRDAGGER